MNSTLDTQEDPGSGITPTPLLDGVNDQYRFIFESLLILISVVANILGLAVVVLTQTKSTQKSVYHILYIYVSATNIAACLVTWFCGNLIVFFWSWFQRNEMTESAKYCEATVYRHLTLPLSLSVAILMNTAMLGLATCQYYAICKPLNSRFVLQKRRAYLFIGFSLLAFLVCAGIALCILIIPAISKQCSLGSEAYNIILKTATTISNIFLAIIVFLYILMVAVGIRVYIEIRAFSNRTKRLSRQKSINACEKRLATDKRAYTATMVLILSRTLITLPLTIYFVYDLNLHGYKNNMTVLYLSIFPCIKCIFDPIIYGALMRDVNKTWRQLRCAGNRLSADTSKLSSSASHRFSSSIGVNNTVSSDVNRTVKGGNDNTLDSLRKHDFIL